MQPRPLTYRAEIIKPLLASIVAGECCSVVGSNGVGKSNLVQHLLRPDVLRHHLGVQAEPLQFVIVDINLLAEWSSWGFFESLIASLLSNSGKSLPGDVVEWLRGAHDQILAATGHYTLALRLCAEALELICAQSRLVLLFDEFDRLFGQLHETVPRNLRGLRDRHKYRLMYLTFSRQPLISLRDDADWDEIEPFVELLTLRELGLQPLSDADAVAEIARFAERHQCTLDTAAQAKILALSGGHPALLRALVQAELLTENRAMAQNEQVNQLPVIRLECTKIWQQLPGDEQDTLLLVAHGNRMYDQPTQNLLLKGLLRPGPAGALSIFSPLFRSYLTSMGEPPYGTPVPIHVNIQQRTVHYYGQEISNFISQHEYRLLAHLWNHLGQTRPIAEVAEAVYPGEDNEDLERLRILTRRLRRRLNNLAPDQPVPLNIHRMRGYRLGISPEPGVRP